MPAEPPPTPWTFPPPQAAGPDGVVAVGGDLRPGTLLAAYRSGLFPMNLSTGELAWWSPDPRAILPLDNWAPSTSLRKSIRRYETTVDESFRDVAMGCADPTRPHGWITAEFVDAYEQLHRAGWAHSFEVWDEGELIGGLYGVAIGGFFAGESMFHRRRDASKVALDRAVSWMRQREMTLFDVQWLTPHLESLGAIEVGREVYLSRLAPAVG